MLARTLRAMVSLTAVATLAACDSSTGTTPTGQLTVRLTDAPSPSFQAATAYIRAVVLIRGGDTTGNRDTILIAPGARAYDLFALTNGVTAALGSLTVPTGSYTQLRLLVDSARVTLKAPLMFNDGSTTKLMTTPSAYQSGIKVVFGGPVNVVVGETILVVDFDVLRNFVTTGPAASPTGVLFKPVLHATVQNIASSIAGVVTPASANATVYAIISNDTVQTAIADGVTGAYKLRFLPAGAYSVSAAGSGVAVTKTLTLRASQDTTGVNFP